MTEQATLKWGVRQWCALLLLISCALLGNVFAPRLFTGFNYLLGSIGVMLGLRLFGIGWAVVAALLAAAWCKQLFGHYYPLIWLGLEPLFVGLWLKRHPRQTMITADMLYWLMIGAPSIVLVFLSVLGISTLGTAAATLMYTTIGITNALIATMLLNHLPLERLVWPYRPLKRVSIAQLLFQVLMLAIIVPAMLLLVLNGRNRETVVKLKMFDQLEIKVRQVGYEVRQKIFNGSYPVLFGPQERADLDVKAVQNVLGGVGAGQSLALHLMANQGEVIASTDPAVMAMEFYDPLLAGTVRPLEREQLYHRMPPNTPPIPLWQRAGRSVYIRIYRIPSTTVYVIAETPFAPYQAQILRGHRNALAGLLLYLLVGAWLAHMVARRIARPLEQLSRTTTDLPQRLMTEDMNWPESPVAEVNALVDNARKMAHTLAVQFRQIADSNNELENRVVERTRELEAKNKELESIIYVASHDLRSPLVNIQGFSRKLAKQCEGLQKQLAASSLPPEQQAAFAHVLTDEMPRSVSYITGSVEKMDALLSGLLRLSRLGRAALCIETLDMNRLMAKITNSLAYQLESCGAAVRIEELLPCQGDAVQLSQVFTNLLDNAIKYRSPDRPLQITVTSSPGESGRVRYLIRDNGIGIHPDHQSQVWEIFHRINPRDIPGEGLGLTASRRILDRMNGAIWLESQEGVGSCFFVELPA